MQNRRHGRVKAQGVASHLRGDGKFAPGMAVENLSMGGAYIRSAEPMPVGTPLVLDLVRPGLKKALKLTGRVVSILMPPDAQKERRSPGMGIQFDPLNDEQEQRLRELLLLLAPGAAVLEGDVPEEPGAKQVEPLSSGAAYERATEPELVLEPEPEPEPPPTSAPAPAPAPAARVPPTLHPAAASPRPVAAAPVATQAVAPIPTPAAAPPPAAPPPAQGIPIEAGRLMVQVRGLLLELGDRDSRVHELEREVERLNAEVARLNAQLGARRR